MNRLILAPLAAILCHAQPAPAPDGHWAGAIQLPGQELRILVDLVAGPPWQGHISIPAQGLKDFPLSDVKGDPAIVGFRLPGIPGDPTFTGRYDGGAIRGTFSQGGMTFPFILERKAPEALPQPPQGVTERDLACGTEPFVLPGTLALPAGKGPWPAVVLVHGSGPNDRDENVGSNAPFRDLAWGLAARGIVVYRYDKRTRVHPKELRVRIGDKLTVQEETVLDAADAAALLRRQPGVDPSKVFVLGHSLGAMCLPRIGTRTTFAAGYIALAGPNRPLEDLIVEQMEHLGAPAAAVADMKVKAAHVKDLEAGKPAAGPLPLDVPAAYWLDLKGYIPAQAARELDRPFLVLQGGRDYQVTLKDFEGWRKALEGRPGTAFKVFPALNHLFIAGTGPSTGSEYGVPGHVDGEVLDTIATWIKAR